MNQDPDRYIEGFLAGQAVAYCERVITGMSMAARLVCPNAYRNALVDLIDKEKCKVLEEESSGNGQVSLWIFRHELAARLIADLQSAPDGSELGIWSMGKLLGYANHEVDTFIVDSQISEGLKLKKESRHNRDKIFGRAPTR